MVKIVMCPKCKTKKEIVNNKQITFECCGARKNIKKNTIKEKYRYQSEVKISESVNTSDDKKENIEPLGVSDDTNSLSLKGSIKKNDEEINIEVEDMTEEKKEEETKNTEEDIKYQCAYCSHKFNSYENNECPSCKNSFD